MKAPTSAIPIDWLREAFRVDESTGHVYWRHRPLSHFSSEKSAAHFNSWKAGQRADLGFYPTEHYPRIRVSYGGRKITISAHRVVFALVHGAWPSQVVDHIDRDRTNNVPSNLRDVSQRENCLNRKAA